MTHLYISNPYIILQKYLTDGIHSILISAGKYLFHFGWFKIYWKYFTYGQMTNTKRNMAFQQCSTPGYKSFWKTWFKALTQGPREIIFLWKCPATLSAFCSGTNIQLGGGKQVKWKPMRLPSVLGIVLDETHSLKNTVQV